MLTARLFRLNPTHAGRVFVSQEEKLIQKRLEVALACCNEEYGGCHGHSHGDLQDYARDSEEHDHGVTCGPNCHEHDHSHHQNVNGAEDDTDSDIDSDEELLRMGIAADGSILDDEFGDVAEIEPGATTLGGSTRGPSVAQQQQARREAYMREQISSRMTQNFTELQAVTKLSAALGMPAPTSPERNRVRYAFSSNSNTSRTDSGATEMQFPIIGLVHRLHSFIDVDPTPEEAAVDTALRTALCDILIERGQASTAPQPFSYIRVRVASVSEPSAPLRQFLAGLCPAPYDDLPCVICLRGPCVPAVVLAGTPQIESHFGRGLRNYNRNRVYDTDSADDETRSKVRLWLERVAGLSVHSGHGKDIAQSAGFRSTHHAMSEASEAALRGNGSEDEEDEETSWCGRSGCTKQFPHKHIDAEHMASAHNRKMFMSNEFH